MYDEPSSGQPSHDTKQEGRTPQDGDESPRREHQISARGTDVDDAISDAESVDMMFQDIEDATLYPSRSERRAPLKERIKQGPKRAVQQMAYTRLLEDRMQDLEKRLRLVEGREEYSEPPTPPSEKMKHPTDFIMDIKRMTFQDYSPTKPNSGLRITEGFISLEHKRRYEFPGQLPYHLIDVVVSATHPPKLLDEEQGTRPAASPPNLAASSLAIPIEDPPTGDGQLIQPERIRINSTLLLEALQKITGLLFTKSRVPEDTGRELLDQVILRPFKLLVTFEKEIRDEIERLEKEHMPNSDGRKAEAPKNTKSLDQDLPLQPISNPLHGAPKLSSQDHSVGLQDNKAQPTTRDHSVDGEIEDIPPLESIRCLEELRVLRELLDKDLKPTIDLRKQIKDGVTRSIAFQDLWHLFPLGDEIVSDDANGQVQVYRILNVSGGKPFLCDRWQAEMDEWDSKSNGRDVPKFEILSYFYDFDGKELGACQQVHTIKSYDGKKAITSLPCYPIIYSKNLRKLKPRDFFIERGRRFIDLTRKSDVVHKRYDGLTLVMDEIREEVRKTLNIYKPLYNLRAIRSIPRSS